MIANPSALDLIGRVLFLFGYALLFALAEIEIEGEHGWAERLPTWFRVTTPGARLFGFFLGGKPLTGYHLVMFALPLWSFHIGFVGGAPWSWAAEATTLAAYFVWLATWDLLWFLLNPRYGWARFRKGEIWWHSRTWIGRFPIDYWAALVTSFALAASARLATGDFGVLGRHVALVIGFGALTLLTNVAAPRYMRWHAHMRRPGSDERGRALPQSNGGASNGKQPLDDAQGRSKLEPNHEANSGSGSA
jgi:hypothetical protein